MNRLLQVLARGVLLLRHAFRQLTAGPDRPNRQGRTAEARARFWTELRQGQHEAEVEASKSDS